MLEQLIFWSLKERGSSIRGQGLNLLTKFAFEQKFTSLDEIVEITRFLLSSYNTPMLG